ncbi:hypothetical protein IGJ51_001109 [Enterococcus sp. DIV0802c]
MMVAIDKHGKRYLATTCTKRQSLFCPACKEPVILKTGQRKQHILLTKIYRIVLVLVRKKQRSISNSKNIFLSGVDNLLLIRLS